MSSKNIFSVLLICVSALLYFNFVAPFKVAVVDPVTDELNQIQQGYEKSIELLSLNNLRQKRQSLGSEQTALLQNLIPRNLHSGDLIYRLTQIANLNRLAVRGVQFSAIEDTTKSANVDKKLLIEMTLNGSYSDFYNWLNTVERANTLIDVQSISANKNSVGDIISFKVKMYAYGINID